MVLLSVTSLKGEGRDLRLVEAAREGDRETLSRLLQEQVDVNLAPLDGATALHWAAHRGDLGAVQLLIGAGAGVDAANAYGVTPLSLACTNRNFPLVEKLLEAGADPNSTRWTGETVLMTCARTGRLSAVKSLLNHGADPNVRENRWEQTPLMWAVGGGHPAVTGALVEHGADVQARSKAGFTALMFAAQQGELAALAPAKTEGLLGVLGQGGVAEFAETLAAGHLGQAERYLADGPALDSHGGLQPLVKL